MYTFVFGRIPFNAPNVFKLFQVVQHEPLRFPEAPIVSSDLKDLLQRMLCKVLPLLCWKLSIDIMGGTRSGSEARFKAYTYKIVNVLQECMCITLSSAD